VGAYTLSDNHCWNCHWGCWGYPTTGQMAFQALIWLNEHRLGHFLLSSVHCALK